MKEVRPRERWMRMSNVKTASVRLLLRILVLSYDLPFLLSSRQWRRDGRTDIVVVRSDADRRATDLRHRKEGTDQCGGGGGNGDATARFFPSAAKIPSFLSIFANNANAGAAPSLISSPRSALQGEGWRRLAPSIAVRGTAGFSVLYIRKHFIR